MANMITLRIDDKTVTVPAGTLIVDAAKKIGNDIPVFCYHPKMEPVGMCRMCLVSIGRPAVDRATNQPLLNEDGTPKIAFGPKLETACTTPVSEGMVVVTSSEQVGEARKDVLEFLLTSHPLDCPICDKGGECPLQNLTYAFGSGKSRFLLDEKIHLAKHYPLGELIFLDRERCIQCGRCVRFQDEVAGDPVIGFSQRGRALEIITFSEPGFDSIFSGNTTDICPVGALTTADFRFNARPWELKSVASVCNHCPVGCNTTLDVRREAAIGGGVSIKRIMPRQNEGVNEIWICDKGRWAHHYTEAPDRLTQPLVRRGGRLEKATWAEAVEAAANAIRAMKDSPAPQKFVSLAGGRLSNEDLFNLNALTKAFNGESLLDSAMAGGDLTAQLAPGPGSNFKDMGAGSAILVAACNLEEEAPLWFLRVKQAAERGATLIVVNPRPTKLDQYTSFTFRYAYGQEIPALERFLPVEASGEPASGADADASRQAVEAFRSAENAVVIYGSEGIGLQTSAALARKCAELLIATNHTWRPNNGLIAAWEKGNVQGAWDMGFRPTSELAAKLADAGVLYVAAADPAGDDPALAEAVDRAGFVIVNEFFLTETASRADVVFPADVFSEREGTYTSGERQVQRFYPAVPARPAEGVISPLPDYRIVARLGERLGIALEGAGAGPVFQQIAAQVKDYAGLSYRKVSQVEEQWPIIGREDLFYGGTGYANQQGLGVRLPNAAGQGDPIRLTDTPAFESLQTGGDELVVFPMTRLYDQGRLVRPSRLLQRRLAEKALWMHPDTARQFGLEDGSPVEIEINGSRYTVGICPDESLPVGLAIAPRSVGLPLDGPVKVSVIKE